MRVEDSDDTAKEENSKQMLNANGHIDNIEDKVKIGDVIGGCELLELIGKGGMGAVYKAKQISLDKIVAVKILSPKYWEDDEFIDNFVSEARIAAKLDHQNVVQVFDTGTDNKIPFIIMQLVTGKTLRQIEKERKIPFDELLEYFIQACKGLLSAHSRKVVHRDIKPENLIITTDGYLKITDFGLAKHEKDIPDELPTNGKIMASASFMSPEQADLHPIDVRSDLYSLGVTFYSLFAEVKPFVGESHLELVLRHHLDQPLCATLHNRDIPLSLAAIFHKLMRKRPVFRYQSVNALLADLEKIKNLQYPKIEQSWRFESFAVSKIDAGSIDKRGVTRCLRAQKESKSKNAPFSNLGEMMHAKDFLKIIKPADSDKILPEDLPFLIPKSLKLPDGEVDTQEISLSKFVSVSLKKRDTNNKPIFRMRRANIDVDFYHKDLILYIRESFSDIFTVQHLFDLLDHFPYPLDFKVQLWFEDDITLENNDISWLIDIHNLINRKKGNLKVLVFSTLVEDFINNNKLADFLDVEFPKRKHIDVSFEDFSEVINSVVEEVVEEVDLFDLDSQIGLNLSGKSEENMNENNEKEKPQDEIIDELETNVEAAKADEVKKEDAKPEEKKESEDAQALDVRIVEKINVGDFDSAYRLAKKYIMSGKEIKADVAESLEKIGRKFKFEGETLMKKEDFEGAKEFFEKALSVRNNDSDAYYLKGLCLKKLGKLSSAVEFLNAAIDLNPDNAHYYYNRAIITSRMKRLSEAISDLSKSVEINPNHANAFYNRGIAYEKLKEYAKALEDYKKALNLNPDYRKILTPRLKKIALELEKNSES